MPTAAPPRCRGRPKPEFVQAFVEAWGPEGYLVEEHGMIANPDDVRARNAEIAANMTPLNRADLE